MRALLACSMLVAWGCTPLPNDDAQMARSAAASATNTAAEPRAQPGGKLIVASYNVLYALGTEAGVDADTLARASTLEADVLLLQETNPAWEAALRPALAARYPYCRFHPPKRYAPGGLATCARAPIVEDRSIDSPVAWFPAQRTVVAFDEGALQTINVHLRPAVASPPDWMRVHHETRPERAREIGAYVALLAPDVPAIIAGDFNELAEGDLFPILARAGLDSAFARAESEAITWQWVGSDPPLALQLDHITYSRQNLTLEAIDVLPGGRSDHQAIVATFRR